MSLDRLREIKLFEGKSLDEIFQVIYSQSLEEREEAIVTFKRFREMVSDPEDLFMSGDKPHPYLDSAHKATENLIKMITASHKLLELESEEKDSVNMFDTQLGCRYPSQSQKSFLTNFLKTSGVNLSAIVPKISVGLPVYE